MNTAAVLIVVLSAGLWPFGNKHKVHEGDTIKSLESEMVEVDTFTQIADSEAKAIDSYRLFLDLVSDDPLLRAEAMRRLADLQLETSEALELQENIAALEETEMSGAVDLYTQLLESYPDYAKNDLVLYQLARAVEFTGDTERALQTLDRLVREYPQTVHYDEAHFRRGEMLFVNKRYREADEAYAKVLQTGPAATFFEQALYKSGWALFKQTLHEESLDPFFMLLDRKLIPYDDTPDVAEKDADTGSILASMGRADQELAEDTFRVLSISFSYMDGPGSITEYVEKRGQPPYAYMLYTNLGDLYLEKERYQDAAVAYQAFVDLDPYHAKAPLLQVEVIEAYKRGQFASLVLDGKKSFVEIYGPGSPYWERHTFEQAPEVVGHLKSNLTDLAKYYHAQAQQSKKPADYAVAARWYRDYLQSFPDDPDASQTNFLLAEVLFESGDYATAALEYERTAYGYPFHERGGEAGYAALLAYRKHEEGLEDPEQKLAWHRQGIDSALRFAGSYPQHEQTAPVLTDAAEKLFALNEFEDAIQVGLQVTSRQPEVDPVLMRTAWTVIAHSQFDLGQYAASESAYQQLQARVPRDDPEYTEISERIASSIYKQAEQAQVAGDMSGAVDAFLRVGRAAPGATILPNAEYDAATALIQMGDWVRAAEVLESFRSNHPDHPLQADATAKLAVAYVEAGDRRRAASEFERIADGAGATPEIQKEALWRAAELYAETGQPAAAGSAYARYVERYPTPVAEAVEARQKIVVLAEEMGDYGARTQWLASIIEADAGAGAQRTDRTRLLAARAALILAQPSREAFNGVTLVVPLEQSLKLKKARMEEALSAYGRAADYGVAEVTTAATYEIAQLYNRFSQALFSSERPPGLSAEELEQYDILLEEQAYPLEEQAIELHEVNVARTADGVYDEWVQKSLSELAQLMPIRYAKDEQGETVVAGIR
jgi:TolA-binding protein